jgi:HprK-related kinase A
MLIKELNEDALATRLAGEGIALDFGAGNARIFSEIADLPAVVRQLYGSFDLLPTEGFFDATGRLRRARGVRRHFGRQIVFVVDGRPLFYPFPAETHFPLLEWGFNYLFAGRLNFHLLLHAGVVECEGKGIVLPALPGSGKSTLTAAVSLRGFRLLSDEFGVVRLDDGKLLPLLKPVGLKNESIDVIRSFAPEAVIGPRFYKTRKGTVAHLAPAAASVERRHEPAEPALVVFPRYNRNVDLRIEAVPKSRAFGRLAVNSFNYEMLGPEGFDAVTRLVQRCDCFQLEYRELDRAVEALRELASAACRRQPIH